MTFIDRDALLDVLKAKCRERCPGGYDPAKCRNRCDAADEIALVEDAPAVVPDVQRWRDAKKDPPDHMVDVIAYCADGSILTAFRYESGDWAESRKNLMLDDVTHWMPNITGPEREESGA